MENRIFISRYFYLLVTLALFFLVNPFLDDTHLSSLILISFFALIMVLSVWTVAHSLMLIIFTAFIGTLSSVSYSYLLWAHASPEFYIIHFALNILFLSIITLNLIHSILGQKKITSDTLFGAICGYLLIGLIWSYIYLVIVSVDPRSFSLHIENESVRAHIDHFIYYSFETLTTLGFGDILPLKGVARTFSWIEAALGQIYLAVWISQLVGLRITEKFYPQS